MTQTTIIQAKINRCSLAHTHVRAYKRSRLIMCTHRVHIWGTLWVPHYNGYPVGVPICTPTGCIIGAGSPKGGRATTKKKKVATYNGCPQGTHMHAPQGHALMGWVPYPAHMVPHSVGTITPFGLQKSQVNLV